MTKFRLITAEAVRSIGANVSTTFASAVSVLIFLCVIIIAFLFVKGFGANLSQQRGER